MSPMCWPRFLLWRFHSRLVSFFAMVSATWALERDVARDRRSVAGGLGLGCDDGRGLGTDRAVPVDPELPCAATAFAEFYGWCGHDAVSLRCVMSCSRSISAWISLRSRGMMTRLTRIW